MSDEETLFVHLRLFETEDEVHMIPTDDVIEHVPSPRCECCPTRDFSMEGMEHEMSVGKEVYLHYGKSMREYH